MNKEIIIKIALFLGLCNSIVIASGAGHDVPSSGGGNGKSRTSLALAGATMMGSGSGASAAHHTAVAGATPLQQPSGQKRSKPESDRQWRIDNLSSSAGVSGYSGGPAYNKKAEEEDRAARIAREATSATTTIIFTAVPLTPAEVAAMSEDDVLAVCRRSTVLASPPPPAAPIPAPSAPSTMVSLAAGPASAASAAGLPAPAAASITPDYAAPPAPPSAPIPALEAVAAAASSAGTQHHNRKASGGGPGAKYAYEGEGSAPRPEGGTSSALAIYVAPPEGVVSRFSAIRAPQTPSGASTAAPTALAVPALFVSATSAGGATTGSGARPPAHHSPSLGAAVGAASPTEVSPRIGDSAAGNGQSALGTARSLMSSGAVSSRGGGGPGSGRGEGASLLAPPTPGAHVAPSARAAEPSLPGTPHDNASPPEDDNRRSIARNTHPNAPAPGEGTSEEQERGTCAAIWYYITCCYCCGLCT